MRAEGVKFSRGNICHGGEVRCRVRARFLHPHMSIEPDRPTQAFLSRFSEPVMQEAERLRAAGAVKQIFGGAALVHARVEDGSDVYHITLRRGNVGWEWTVSGPEDQHPAAVAAVMVERLARGDALPESPMEVGDTSLIEVLEEKLGRALSPQEDVFIDKLEKRYRRWLLEQKLFDHDLVRLNPKWVVAGYEPITLWPEPPRDILEFWNYIAAAFDKKRLPWPKFMEAVTSREQTKEQMREWERQRELSTWQERLERVASAEPVTAHAGELRAMVTTREVRLEFRRTDGLEGPDAFAALGGEVELLRLRQQVAEGRVSLTPLSEALFMQWIGHWPEGDAPSPGIRLESERDRGFLGRLLRQPALSALVVTLDEAAFVHSDERLRWTCVEPEEEEEESDAWMLQLTTPDELPVPYTLTVLPGPETLYLGDDTVYRGPVPWMEGTEAKPRCPVPREVLASAAGVEFLRRLGIDLPASLRERVMEVVVRPRLAMRLSRRGAAADAEVVSAECSAGDDEGLCSEVLERDTWRTVESKTPGDGRVPWFDRRALFAIPPLLEELGLTWEAGSRSFRVRLTKNFPVRFVKWLERLPAETGVELDAGLETLRADPVQATVRFEVTEAGDLDWFDLKVLVDVEGMELTRQQIRELVEARGGFVRMPDGGWLRLALRLTADQEAAIGHLGLDVYDLSGETHRMHVLQLAEPRAAEVFDADAWNRITDRAARLKLQVRPPVPSGFQLQLRPYQIEGFHFLAYLTSNRFGGVLADDMGLGKTAQAICWMLWLRERAAQLPDSGGVVAPSLVVCPKSVLDVWAGETGKFAPHLRVQVIRDKTELDTENLSQRVDVLVLNYSQLRVNSEKLKAVAWLSVVLDEGQQIKNPDSMAARSARELSSENRLVLSGTPIENRLLDVWSLMAFAMPGVLGNRKYFKDRFDRRKDTGAQGRLSARLRPFLLRRTKGQVALDLPSRTEEDILSPLEETQETLYAAELARMQRILLGFDSDAALQKNSFVILQGLMRLRQICCHPALIDEQHKDVPSAKMNALFYLLDQLKEANHKVLVFSQFTSMLDIIKGRLEQEDRPHLLLTGQTKDRDQVVRTFHTSKDPHVFLLSLKAGGTGLNLTSASYVVLYDPWWNPAVENQAIDRTHRIGQTNPVMAYRLLARNTVEEKIRRLQHQKQQLVSGVLGEESFTKNLGLEDVRSLFARDDDPLPEVRAKRPVRRAARKVEDPFA